MQFRQFTPMFAALAGLLVGTAIADSRLTPSRARDELQAAGFTNIERLHREKDHYEVVAMRDGMRRSVNLDSHTGTITTEARPAPPPPKSEEQKQQEKAALEQQNGGGQKNDSSQLPDHVQ